jgi:phospholipid/cholesterol/gamma-HCH transport system permease protein
LDGDSNTGGDMKVISWFAFLAHLLVATARQIITGKFRFHLTLKEMYHSAVETLPLAVCSLTLIGLLLVLEFSYHMKIVIQQDSLVPSFSTLMLIRELVPVVTCLCIAFRVGASMAAELSLMTMTDQVDALRVLRRNPFDVLIVPKLWGIFFASLTLSFISIVVSLIASVVMGSAHLGYQPLEFAQSLFLFTKTSDWVICFVKASIFSLIITVLAGYQGFRPRFGAQGVGEASTQSVVDATLMIIIADFLVTFLAV